MKLIKTRKRDGHEYRIMQDERGHFHSPDTGGNKPEGGFPRYRQVYAHISRWILERHGRLKVRFTCYGEESGGCGISHYSPAAAARCLAASGYADRKLVPVEADDWVVKAGDV